ncbi:hypothetical protein DPSP01_012687 [Paraphaeosphaeria sporulosa]|uniref:Uncharacterized protein n=1 Tax=Paraphaeosphaeria sporulosa TaxID=1460663 RepID=A0A177C8K2_9PLEO|nr:uncharacterized protein CC84DRAFT_1166920 [Paraphaeosphaeria sporulosa]OAG03179.1 hypothetical protein CC84DRAFT_1166920 [Paraphaeosphaeria sporulosa]
MSNSLSPYDMATNMTAYAPNPYRTARSSNSQPGHPYRVEKPRSNHNSPRTVERRKTTTGAKLYATLDDHYNMMMGITSNEEIEPMGEPANTRPMSWHPSSNQYYTRPQSTMFDQSQDWSQTYSDQTSVQGSDFYSFSARNSMGADTTQQYPTYMTGYETHRGSQDSDSSWQTQQSQQSHVHSAYSTPATEPMPWYLQEWARKNQEQAASQNNSMDFLPIQHPTEPEEQQAGASMEDSGKELIGMGLYDVSDSSLDWTSPLGEATGKGLKLEETWQPPEEDEDEDDDDQDDNASSDDGEEELPPPPAPVAPVASAKDQPAGNMEGQSFFFDEDENISKEWWYQHLKQPSMPVRDAGYGYGWL